MPQNKSVQAKIVSTSTNGTILASPNKYAKLHNLATDKFDEGQEYTNLINEQSNNNNSDQSTQQSKRNKQHFKQLRCTMERT